jgi:integrase
MTSKPLTQKALDAIRPSAARQEISDAPLPGFSGRLRFVMQPSGAASWIVRYRHIGKPRKLTLGSYPRIGLAQARQDAREALRTIGDGRDPAAERKASKAAAALPSPGPETVAAVVEEYIARHVREHSKPTSASEIERMLRKEIATPWGDHIFREKTRRDVIKLLDAIRDRGSPYTANRVFELLRSLWKFARARGIVENEESPCADMKPPCAEVKRDRVLDADELRLFWRAVETTPYPFGPIFKLLLLTGQRRDEVAGMRRSELDLGAREWIIPKERTKNGHAHTVPLSQAAVAILEAMPTVQASGGHVFSTTGTTAVSGYSKAKARLDAAMLKAAQKDDPNAALSPWRLHDLRRTAATGMGDLGIAPHVIEAALNHISGHKAGVAGVYNRAAYAPEKKAALEAWARFLESLTTDAPASNVVALRA